MKQELSSVVRGYLRSTGPVSFAGICAEVSRQYVGRAEVFEVAEVLTHLIRKGDAKIYDDGQSYDADGNY